jgi:hypothetical protein
MHLQPWKSPKRNKKWGKYRVSNQRGQCWWCGKTICDVKLQIFGHYYVGFGVDRVVDRAINWMFKGI